MDLVDQRRFADTRVARDEDELGRALAGLIERCQERLDLSFTALELLWDVKAPGEIVLAKREWRDLAGGAQPLEAEL